MTDLTGARNQCPGRRVVVVPVTSVRDGLEHLVADEAMTPGSAGRYVASCGDVVWAAALACPPGPRCPACVAARTPDPASGRRRHCQHRPGVGAWWNLILRRRHGAAGATDGARDAD